MRSSIARFNEIVASEIRITGKALHINEDVSHMFENVCGMLNITIPV